MDLDGEPRGFARRLRPGDPRRARLGSRKVHAPSLSRPLRPLRRGLRRAPSLRVGEVGVDLERQAQRDRRAAEVGDVDVLVHPVADGAREPQLDRLLGDVVRSPASRELGRPPGRADVVAEPGVLGDVRERHASVAQPRPPASASRETSRVCWTQSPDPRRPRGSSLRSRFRRRCGPGSHRKCRPGAADGQKVALPPSDGLRGDTDRARSKIARGGGPQAAAENSARPASVAPRAMKTRSPAAAGLLAALLPLAAAAAGDLETELGRNESRVYAAPFVIPAGARSRIWRCRSGSSVSAIAASTTGRPRRASTSMATKCSGFTGGAVTLSARTGRRRSSGSISGAAERLLGLRLQMARRARSATRRRLARAGGARRISRRAAPFAPGSRSTHCPSASGGRCSPPRMRDSSSTPAWTRAPWRGQRCAISWPDGRPRRLTITQQLIKNRDLGPERTLGRKASEAMRALALEAAYDKREILQAYLNSSTSGTWTASRCTASAPRRGSFSPSRRRPFARRGGGAGGDDPGTESALPARPPRLCAPGATGCCRAWRSWLGEQGRGGARQGAGSRASSRRRARRGGAVRRLGGRGARRRRSRRARLSGRDDARPMAATARRAGCGRTARGTAKSYPACAPSCRPRSWRSTAATGEVLAYVGGDPARRGFDRVRSAKRQPGSVVKPFVALEAIERCGRRDPLTASSRIADEPLTIDLPSGGWRPENFDRQFHGPVLLREALAESRNVPSVRIARWCGFDSTAETFARAGFALPRDPAALLRARRGGVEPVAGGERLHRVLDPRPRARALSRCAASRPRAAAASTEGPHSRRVASAESTYIVRDLLRSAVERGTAAAGGIPGFDVAAKTGSSSELRDAWFAGQAGSVVTAVWVGLDGGGRLGLTGAQAAGPIWHDFMSAAAARAPAARARAPRWPPRALGPDRNRSHRPHRAGSRQELYRKARCQRDGAGGESTSQCPSSSSATRGQPPAEPERRADAQRRENGVAALDQPELRAAVLG